MAAEVRALAQRSAEAAKEIKALISTSGQQVTEGVALVDDTGNALGRIVGQVSEITDIVNGMAASAQEQSAALQEVNVAINQMDQVTQQNAAMVEQSTAASHALSQEAAQLAESVGQFQIGQAAAHAQREPPRAPNVIRLPSVGAAKNRTLPSAKSKLKRGGTAAATPRTEEWEEF